METIGFDAAAAQDIAEDCRSNKITNHEQRGRLRSAVDDPRQMCSVAAFARRRLHLCWRAWEGAAAAVKINCLRDSDVTGWDGVSPRMAAAGPDAP